MIRHSTLVPGVTLAPDCDPRHPGAPSIFLNRTSAHLRIDSSIVGAIQVISGPKEEPARISICDSIVDATSETRTAIAGAGGATAFAELTACRTTLIGRVVVHAITLAEDSLFVGLLCVARSQVGCVRYCYIRHGSRTPKRYRCQPETALEDARRALPTATPAPQNKIKLSTVELRVQPTFESQRYGAPNYLRLTACTPAEIKQGAHDQSEMGVYHDLFEPQRGAALAKNLADFVPASCDSAVIFPT
jgi:hypothetical protein